MDNQAVKLSNICGVSHLMTYKGDAVHVDWGVEQSYQKKIGLHKEREPWKARLVMSTLPSHQLPRSLKQKGARQICTLEARLHKDDMQRKNHHFWNRVEEYNMAEFSVRVDIGVGVRFSIVGKSGEVRGDQEEVDVKWERERE